jgi:hypothetical protein
VYFDQPHGSLSNGGEKLYLERPGTASLGLPNSAYILIDAVNYDDDPPWTALADGGGPSLSRFSSTEYGNDVANWGAGANGGTPGRLNVTLDTSPPSVPVDLVGRIVSITQVRLRWGEADDPQSGVSHYNVYRNNVLVGSAPLGVFTDTVTFGPAAFSYQVAAVNGDGFEGSRTPVLSIGGQSVSFQHGVGGYSGAADATIRQGAATTTFGTTEAFLEIDGDDGGGVDKSVLLKWNDLSLPAGSLLLGASITVNVTDPTGNAYGVFPLLRDWNESSVTWNAPWMTAGALGAGERGATSVATFTGGVGSQTFQLNAAGVALVQGWVAGTNTNRGVIVADSAATDGMDFDAREATVAANRPKLTLVYIASPTPFAAGDVNEDGLLDSTDIDDLFAALAAGSGDAVFDVDGNASVNRADVDWLVRNIFDTEYGDTNLDRRIDRRDFAALALNFGRQSGARWSQGDFTGDGRIDLVDMGRLQQQLGFVAPSPAASPPADTSVVRRRATRATLVDRVLEMAPDSEAFHSAFDSQHLRARRSTTLMRKS